MKKNKCFVCGSYNLRADRALSGRLVCTSCGSPYGVRKVGGNRSKQLNSFKVINKYIFFIILIFFVFILVII